MAGKSFGARGKKPEDAGLAELREQLKTSRLKNVYVLSGEERFLVDHYLGEIKKAVLGDDKNGLNLVRFEGKTEVGSIIDACDTFPVFAEKKLVIIKNSNLLAARKKGAPEQDDDEEGGARDEEGGDTHGTAEDEGGAGNKAQDALKQYIPNLPAFAFLVMLEDNIDKRLGVYKTLQKQGLHIHFGRQSHDELANWVMKGFRQSGKSISLDAAQYMVDICDSDMYAMKNEIAKIIMYTAGKSEVGRDDVKAVATVTIKSVIFDLMDAVAGRVSADALLYLDDMLSLNEPEQKILAMISKQTGEILKLRMLLDRHYPQDRISQYFPGKHPFAFRKLVEQAGKSDRKHLENFLKKCMEADVAVKSGKLPPRLSLELLVAEM